MILKLIIILAGCVFGILTKKELNYVVIILGVILLLILIWKQRKNLLYFLCSFLFFFLITNFSAPLVNNSLNQEFVVTKKATNYYILKSDGVKFVCYSDEKINYRATIKARGKVEKLEINHSELLSSFNDYLYNQGVHYVFIMDEYSIIKSGDNLRPKIKEYLLRNLSKESQQMVSLLLLADKSESTMLYDDLIELSVVQLFVISGFHLNILGGLLDKLFRKKKAKSIIVPLLLFPYVWLLNFAIPVTRAFLYLLITRITQKRGWRIDKQSIIVLLAIGFLFYDYHLLFSVSYQLTFIVTFVISLLSNLQNKSILFRFIAQPIIIQLSILPIILSFNYQINALAFVFNTVLTLPITILYISSWLVAFIKILDNIYYFFAIGMTKLIANFSELSPPLIMGKPSVAFTICFYIVFILILVYLQLHLRKKVFFACGAILCLCGYQYYRLDLFEQEQVVFLDVDQGDSTLICGAHNNYHLLIDTGGSIYQDVAKQKVVPYLKALGIRKLDMVIITHDDYDHNGALAQLQKNYSVDKVINGWETNHVVYKDFKMTNLNHYYSDKSENNEKSAVFSFNQAGIDFVIMGDATTKIEKCILQEIIPECDVLRIGHHGSKTASDEEYLRALSPKLSIISVGKNRYGLPDEEVLTLLDKLQLAYFRTDSQGYITINKNGVRKNC